MYKVLLLLIDDTWTEVGHSDSFSDAWAFARTLKGTVKIVGPEGEWKVK
jgi:hypothetical protein